MLSETVNKATSMGGMTSPRGPQGAPLNHVRAGVYAAGVLAWHRHFAPAHFLWLETEAMRAARAQMS